MVSGNGGRKWLGPRRGLVWSGTPSLRVTFRVIFDPFSEEVGHLVLPALERSYWGSAVEGRLRDLAVVEECERRRVCSGLRGC